jgi:L-ascorbate metabolism protein UlaG (beta-lactamase superfamily)
MVSTVDIKVNFQSSICLDHNIYVDPYKLTDFTPAKYIFITHNHYDHMSLIDLKKIITKDTYLIAPNSIINEFDDNLIAKDKIIAVEPNIDYNLGTLSFTTIPSYNIAKPYHPKNKNYLGYLITLNNTKYYITGDTDLTTELTNVKTDVLFICIGGTFTMDYEEAAIATNLIKPKLVIPTHYGPTIPNTNDYGLKFSKLLAKDISFKLMF